MLPRPKIGKACTSAYDDGATLACMAVCEGTDIPAKDGKSAEFCRPYITDYPKPTVHKACRSGYSLGFEKGLTAAQALGESVKTEATPISMERATAQQAPVIDEYPPKSEDPIDEPPTRRLLVSMPVTVDDNEIHLEIFSDQDADEQLLTFCSTYMTDSQDSCVRQLSPHVQRKLAAL
eukprot:CAMPEP_0197285722 /NCGR_PEP_ID=MMETSP0890-20130614/1091_1 /TAXON_ID=44058 ORGANISM="Aureoumbra lagunensis, Strain CCMP1510" /NCGR_SAMPLE_ID=MMETSP0890 /ASSEMBLY_ACC=CAM_ASM_000533 /LENGTH=177 /DNA_ID=CAMNT_0042753517 /DNA_START=179 /DNA_END=712 /DNA_ORIENTATION=+